MLLQSYLRLDVIILPLLTKDTATQVFLSLTAPYAPMGKPLSIHLLVCSIFCLFPFTLVTHCTWFHPWTTCLDNATILTTFENFSKAVHFMAFPKPYTALETDGLIINHICLHKIWTWTLSLTRNPCLSLSCGSLFAVSPRLMIWQNMPTKI